MLSSNRTALRSWGVIGLVLLAVLAVEAYQSRFGGAEREERDTVMISVLGRRRQIAGGDVPTGSGTTATSSDSASARRVTTVMGAAELDLRETRLRSGEELQVNIVAVMGAITVRVPDGWTVDARAVPMVGGIQDRRLRPFDALDVPPQAEAGPAPRLVVRGAIVMGQLVIKS